MVSIHEADTTAGRIANVTDSTTGSTIATARPVTGKTSNSTERMGTEVRPSAGESRPPNYRLGILALVLSLFLAASFSSPISTRVWAAECDGVDIDGELFDATVYSYSTGRFYYVQVEFEGDEAIIYFPNGRSRRVTLDDEEIDDPSSISAFDYESGTYWDIDIEDCDAGGAAAPVSPSPPRTIHVQRIIIVYVNGINRGKGLLASNSRVYVPIRLVAESLGAQVDWNSARRQVTVQYNGKTIVLPVGLKYATVDGALRILDSPAALLYQQRAHIALRYVSEFLGATVRWDPNGGAAHVSR